MTESEIKQKISTHYLGALVSKEGFNFEQPKTDYGVDGVVELIDKVEEINGFRYASSGLTFDVQVKSTLIRKVKMGNEFLIYDLAVKNFNDLVRRKHRRENKFGTFIPLILILYLFPENEEDWLEIKSDGKMSINGKAFWFYPSEDSFFSLNKNTVRIEIPLKNQLNFGFCEKMFNLLFPNIL